MSGVSQTVHQGLQIVVIDFKGCEPGTFAPIIAEAQKLILRSPPASVRALTLVEDVRFDMSTVKEMQQFVALTTAHLKGNAVVGVDGMKKVVWGGVKPFYRAPAELCADVEAAKAWLAGLA